MKNAFQKRIARMVDWSGDHALIVLIATALVIAGSWFYASHLDLRSDFLELLPRDSPGFQAFEHQLGRVGGGASLLVVVQSPDRAANEKFIDDLSAKLTDRVETHKKCLAACGLDPASKPGSPPPDAACVAKCGPEMISYLETGTKDVRKFFQDHKWLYADTSDLEEADNTLDHQIALNGGFSLDDDDAPKPVPSPKPVPNSAPTTSAAAPNAPPVNAPAPNPADEKKPALGMDQFRDRWKAQANKNDDFPTGYFATPDGTMLGIRIVTTSGGLGDSSGDSLVGQVENIILDLHPEKYQKGMTWGLAGDIPNALEEKKSLVSDAATATGIAFVLILGGIVIYFRSPWSLIVLAVPAIVGIGCAYSFAMVTFGYVNTSGAFLAAIIFGNGINYPIVLLSRYREFRARGQEAKEARRDAVLNAFRAELVGAMVGGIAYGSLIVTRFRGFSQFGLIGFVGMLLVWASMIPTVPALIVAIEWLQSKLPRYLRDPPLRFDPDGTRGPIIKRIAAVTERFPKLFLALAAVACIFSLIKLPQFLHDPWEYNFDNLGSRGSKHGGAGEWSNKAEKVFGGKMNIAGALMLADDAEEVPLIKKQIFQNDADDKQGQLVAQVATVDDLLPGSPDEQKHKLEILDRIRDKLTDNVLASMSPEERERVAEIKPPEDLDVVHPKDLPPLLRRRFEEANGTVGSVFYVKYKNDVSLSDGHNLLRIAHTTDDIHLPDGRIVQTASRSTIFAEMLRSMERDGPLATVVSLSAVLLVVILATRSIRGAVAVFSALLIGVLWAVGGGAFFGLKLNFLNFIALPITFGIGCEYPFNVYDRSRLLGGDITSALKRTGGAVALCSFTTAIGYSSLLFADNQALQSFGRLAMSGELACIVTALFVLPSLLHLWKPSAKELAVKPQ
ncbi:MAG: MMPL family transporter [Polyangiaceae bacterium]